MTAKRSCQIIGIFVCILVLTAAAAADTDRPAQADIGIKDTIQWYRAFFPPVTIPEGPDKDTGFFDRINELLIDHMPQYSHEYKTANFKRIIMEMKKGKNVCCPSLYKTEEREALIAFSVPAVVVLPNVVITKKASNDRLQPYLDSSGSLKLSELLHNEDMVLGISNGRKYSGGIDEILARHHGAGHVLLRSGKDVFKGLLHMLDADRVDYILGYPIEAQYFSRSLRNPDDFRIYFIAENKIAFTIGHVGCPKNDWGEQVIRSVDQVLTDHRRTPEFLGFYESWLDKETIGYYRRIVRRYFESENLDR